MDDRKMEYFFAAVEEGSFTGAAKRCYISQTAISQQIAAMENELGFALFDRRDRVIKLTASGQFFYLKCQALRKAYQEVLQEAKKLNDSKKQMLKIGFSGVLEEWFLAKLLITYCHENPQVDITLHQHNLSRLIQEIKNGFLDVIFGYEKDVGAVAGLDNYSLFKNQLCVITGLNHPWNQRDVVFGKELEGQKLISFTKRFNEKYSSFLQSACQAKGFEPLIVKEVNTFGEMQLEVAINNGIAIVSKVMVENNDLLHVAKLEEFYNQSDYCIAIAKQNSNEAAQKMIHTALNFFGKHNI